MSSGSAATEAASVGGRATVRDRLTLLLFTLIVALLFADQNLLAPSLTAIGDEFTSPAPRSISAWAPT